MKRGYKALIALNCLILVIGAFFIGYYGTSKKIGSQTPEKKPAAPAEEKSGGQLVELISREERVTKQTVLEKRVESINTGASKVEYSGAVPDAILGYTKEQVIDYFKNYGDVTEFSRDKITVVRKLPNLPNCYLIKLDGNYLIIYSTDSDGLAEKCQEPIPYSNMDENLERGIEKDTLDEIYQIVEDYN